MTNPSTIPRSLALNTFYGAHSRFAVQSQGDICHLSRAARAVQPLLVPLPEHEQCGCRPQPEHEPRDGRSDDGTYTFLNLERRQVGVPVFIARRGGLEGP